MSPSLSVVAVAAVLVVGAFVFAGLRTWRPSGTDPHQGSSPFWFWAWAALFLSGLVSLIGTPSAPGVASQIFSPLFPALQLGGAIQYSGRRAPLRLLLLAGIGLGSLRTLAVATGQPAISDAIALAFEPTALFVSAYLIHRTAVREQGHWPDRLMPLALIGVGLVEGSDAIQGLLFAERGLLWQAWVAAAAPLAILQLIARIDAHERVEEEAKRASVAREVADHRFRWLASHTHDVVAEIDRSGRVLWVSESSRALGVDPEDLVGRNALEVVREFNVEHDAPASSVGDDPSTVRLVAHDDEGENRWFDARIVSGPGLDDGTGRIVVAREVTEEVRAEQAIRASEGRFRTFSLLGSDYCFTAEGDLGGNVKNWVTGRLEEISGFSHAELQERGFIAFIHPDDMEDGRQRVMRLIREGGSSNHEFRLLTKSGETRFIAERLLIEREGNRYRIYGAARDITEQRQLEQALRRAQKLESLGLLAGGIAHDFNNLLMAIAGNAELALDGLTRDAASRPHLEATIDAVDEAALLTEQLLAYAGRRAVTRGPVDLSERVRSVSNLLGAGSTRSVDLQLELEPELPAVLADPGGIQQLIMNLVLNAIEACEGGGQVCVTTRKPATLGAAARRWNVGRYEPDTSYVSLEVSDTGAGMSAETLERIFDPFFTTKTAGRGLGLAAAAGIVRSVGGGLQVDAVRGAGTTFTLYLPASETATRAKADTPRATSPSTGRLLVVDDDVRVRRVAADMLRSLGYEVETAADGKEAVSAFRERSFDAVLLDAVMPGMSGADTFYAIREMRPDAIVLMASGFDRESVVGDLLERGLAGFIAKPFRTDELAERLTALLAS